MIVFWNFGIVHADLSEYNILWWNNEPYVIDFPQAIDKKTNPNAEEILDRDLRNITNFFGKFISFFYRFPVRWFLVIFPHQVLAGVFERSFFRLFIDFHRN